MEKATTKQVSYIKHLDKGCFNGMDWSILTKREAGDMIKYLRCVSCCVSSFEIDTVEPPEMRDCVYNEMLKHTSKAFTA